MSLRDLLDRVRTARVEAEACYCRDSLTCQLCGVVMGAEGELATWLLDHPEAVEAVEVLRAWGQTKLAAVDSGSALFLAEQACECGEGSREAWEQAGNAHLVAREAETRAQSAASSLAMKMALAVRLAAKGGG